MSSKPHPGRRRAKKHEEEEHENHERWLVSYADMVTLLMCLFIVLFAISQVDKAKFAALSHGLSASFGAPITALPGTTPEGSVLDALPAAVDIAQGIAPAQQAGQAEVDQAAAQAAAERAARVAAEAQHAYDDLSRTRPASRSTSAASSSTSWPTPSSSTPRRPRCVPRAGRSSPRSRRR
jgi:chemotaxis protein MotB